MQSPHHLPARTTNIFSSKEGNPLNKAERNTMIVNMACPKCGGQATEYDEKKWSCLRCGNKFVFAPVQPSHTFVQSNVHIQGQATFELDVANAKPSSAKMVKMIEHDPNYFGKQIADNALKIMVHQRQASRKKSIQSFALIMCVLLWSFGALAFLGILVGPHDSNSVGSGVVGLVILGLVSLFPFFVFRNFHKEMREYNLMVQNLRQTNASLEQQNLMDTRIGDYIVCPHCETTSDYVPINSPPPVEGLKHCLKCGRQFFTSGLNSFPVFSENESKSLKCFAPLRWKNPRSIRVSAVAKNQPPSELGSPTSPLLKSTYSSVKSAAYISASAQTRFRLMCSSNSFGVFIVFAFPRPA
jgi:ribosomal protein L37AE/L43A